MGSSSFGPGSFGSRDGSPLRHPRTSLLARGSGSGASVAFAPRPAAAAEKIFVAVRIRPTPPRVNNKDAPVRPSAWIADAGEMTVRLRDDVAVLRKAAFYGATQGN